jgi:hypothetical protein
LKLPTTAIQAAIVEGAAFPRREIEERVETGLCSFSPMTEPTMPRTVDSVEP